MHARKRNRGGNPLPTVIKKQKHDDGRAIVTQSIWKSLPRLRERETDIDNTIKSSHVFLILSNEEKLYLKKFIKDISEVIDSKKYVFHERCVELRNFHIMDCCVFLAFVMINLNKFWRKSNENDSCSIIKPFLLRCSIFIHQSCQVKAPIPSRKTSFQSQLAHVSKVPGFKQIEFRSNDLKDLMSGILHQVSNWKFQPPKGSLHKEFADVLSVEKSRLTSAILQLPFFDKVMNLEMAAASNALVIEESKKRLQEHAIKLQEYNDLVVVQKPKNTEEAKPQASENSRPSRHIGASGASSSTSRYQGSVNTHTATDGSTYFHDRKQNSNYVSADDIRKYCIATVDASMDVVAGKSASQITRAYVKCPRTLVDILYQKLTDIRSESNCNIVILNMQTVHESTAWFDKLNVQEYSRVSPPPSTVRVVSIGGVGENCKRALRLLRTFFEQN
ncbi:HEL282Cp [Eremothecium sinecaudum]|uniref:HEL282Cp n=1 Tax=Eremothecium sinecaudum TaxID=45286 RepID=A0A0X8HT54_9SACH|nr:HEL282Cp [Eremothecium sinecaudum]AMD20999.1 HEL282Cp [Eremothecium sinecaudum]